MAFTLRTWSKLQGNLENAGRILVRHETETLGRVGKEVREDLRGRVRKFSGEEARKLKVKLSGRGMNKFVEVFGELIQHVIDEYGLPPGTFQPWGVGSRLYKYVQRKGFSIERKGYKPLHSSSGQGKKPRRLTRKASHVKSRRPSHIRAKLRAEGHQQSRPNPRGKAGNRQGNSQFRGGRDPIQHRRAIASRRRETRTRQISFLVARSIFERGIRANRPFARTLESNRVYIMGELKKAINEAIDEINRG
jgi:hypothetical protein